MSTPRQWRQIVRLNPDYTWQANQQGLDEFRPAALSREVGTTVAWALVDENHGTPSERPAAIAKRATLAQERAQARQRAAAER
jgi:plastocyanin